MDLFIARWRRESWIGHLEEVATTLTVKLKDSEYHTLEARTRSFIAMWTRKRSLVQKHLTVTGFLLHLSR
jgi:hypothetical protein